MEDENCLFKRTTRFLPPIGPRRPKGDLIVGPKGEKGDNRLQELQGEKGDISLQGLKGGKGDAGSQGPKGDPGDFQKDGSQSVTESQYWK